MSAAADETRLLTVTGRDVLFAHWPVPPAALRPSVPEPLALDTFDGSAWLSVLALENPGVAPGRTGVSVSGGGFPQLNLRTYVTVDGEPGVYFLSLDSGRRTPAFVGRRVFGLPFHHAAMSVTRRGAEVTFRSRRRDADPPARFGARYRPDGEPFRPDPDTAAAFCVERFRYYLPGSTDRRPGSRGSALRVGRITREPWTLQPVAATLRQNTLFAAADVPVPDADPLVHYSPRFEMGVAPVERRLSAPPSPDP